ncbi:unnamed protein product [Ceratitis capitata]|uniref:(Mediterranean fruit fly) hypothetical protein n=1 Tax=Ceratitis capitata TaxID=7213 RepID=A0A811UV24_CERCA|nr:unnamed protein product [Ceratitis capitata]
MLHVNCIQQVATSNAGGWWLVTGGSDADARDPAATATATCCHATRSLLYAGKEGLAFIGWVFISSDVLLLLLKSC